MNLFGGSAEERDASGEGLVGVLNEKGVYK